MIKGGKGQETVLRGEGEDSASSLYMSKMLEGKNVKRMDQRRWLRLGFS